MKKRKFWIILSATCLFLLFSTFIYHMVGWSDYDNTLVYIKEYYTSNEQTILSSEYLVSGKDKQGEYILYEVTTEDEENHFIRLDVTFHRYLTKIGSDFKINGISEISDYEIETKIFPDVR